MERSDWREKGRQERRKKLRNEVKKKGLQPCSTRFFALRGSIIKRHKV